MPTTVTEYERFNIPGAVRIESGRGGLPRISIATQLSSGEIYLDGAHITHFQPRGAAPVLFVSKASFFQKGKPIRGGIPVIFPWFGPKADNPAEAAHGFARNMRWGIEAIDQRIDGSVRVVLSLASNADTLARWPHAFLLRLVVVFAATLDVALEARNASNESFEFENALHTYFSVGDVRKATVEGLSGVEYLDKVDAFKRKPQSDPLIRFDGPTDRVYVATTGTCVIHDLATGRSISVEKDGIKFNRRLNPWIASATAMKDFVDNEWMEMVCVETANVGQGRIQLTPGATHRMRASIRLV